ncbi:MAG: class I SAM-dependent methyltransferase [Opitutaceae bacterium]|nr:class I SAM-dependent methyltransferase [Opitutaceae bacterium]
MIGLTTFGILALELGLIRWTSSQVRVFAYFNNLVLIGSFLGMGVGVALGRRWPGLVHATLPLLLVVALPLAFAEQLSLVQLKFPDQTVSLWGGAQFTGSKMLFLRSLAIFLALFSAIVAVFVCAGAPLGYLFSRMPALRAYTADLWGSLLGVLAFAAASWGEAGPPVWLALGTLPFAWLARTGMGWLLAAGLVWLGHFSVGSAVFSAYNRIEITETPLWLDLSVNRDFHQCLHDFSDGRLANPALSADNRAFLQEFRDLYDLPFTVNRQRGTAVVVGAGTGNDVQAAVRNRYRSVVSVDIDGRIIDIGRTQHPEKPYANASVAVVVDDARSFFGKSRERYDVVCFGFLDSHAMSSAMSTLRLDNYVYTEDGIRSAWKRVAEGGHLSLAISCAPGRWFFERMYWTIVRATGHEPIALISPLHGTTVTFLVPREGAVLDGVELARRKVVASISSPGEVVSPTDDWPFLYIRPRVFPWGYVAVLAFIVILAGVSVRYAFGLGRGGGTFDPPLFLMGAAFLLIETRGVTSMSLLFGSTWVVNAVIFGGILLMVLLATVAVRRWQWTDPNGWFWALFAAVVLLYFFPVSWLQTLPFALRAVLAGMLTGLPVGCAGIIVPMLLARSAQPAASLGSNLLGAVLGGCLEYYSMVAGLKSTALMALTLYLLAFLFLKAKRRAPQSAPVESVAVTA